MLTFAAGMPISGRYLLTERLHASRGAQLWSAFDDVLGRPVVVKFFPRALGDEQALTRLHARARSAARLSHAGLVGVLDFGTTEGLPYVVLSLVDGVTLARRLETGKIPAADLLTWTGDIAAALATAHARGVVHGNIDADVLFITSSGAMLGGMVTSAAAHPSHIPAEPTEDVASLIALFRAAGDVELPDCTDAAELARAIGALGPPPPRARSKRILVPAGLTAGIIGVLALGGGLSSLGVAILPTAQPAANQQSNTQGSPTDGSGRTPGTGVTPHPGGSGITTSPGFIPGMSPSPTGEAEFLNGIARVRAIAVSGRELGEIKEPIATQLLAEIDELAALKKPSEGRINALVKHIDGWERSQKITAARSDLLCDALKAMLPKPATTKAPTPVPTPGEPSEGTRTPKPDPSKRVAGQVTGRPST